MKGINRNMVVTTTGILLLGLLGACSSEAGNVPSSPVSSAAATTSPEADKTPEPVLDAAHQKYGAGVEAATALVGQVFTTSSALPSAFAVGYGTSADFATMAPLFGERWAAVSAEIDASAQSYAADPLAPYSGIPGALRPVWGFTHNQPDWTMGTTAPSYEVVGEPTIVVTETGLTFTANTVVTIDGTDPSGNAAQAKLLRVIAYNVAPDADGTGWHLDNIREMSNLFSTGLTAEQLIEQNTAMNAMPEEDLDAMMGN